MCLSLKMIYSKVLAKFADHFCELLMDNCQETRKDRNRPGDDTTLLIMMVSAGSRGDLYCAKDPPPLGLHLYNYTCSTHVLRSQSCMWGIHMYFEQEIKAKLGDGQAIHSGLSSMLALRLRVTVRPRTGIPHSQ